MNPEATVENDSGPTAETRVVVHALVPPPPRQGEGYDHFFPEAEEKYELKACEEKIIQGQCFIEVKTGEILVHDAIVDKTKEEASQDMFLTPDDRGYYKQFVLKIVAGKEGATVVINRPRFEKKY